MVKKQSESDDRFEDIRIFFTNNYDKFHFLEINRKVSKEHVDRLCGKIQEQGFNKHYALKVVANNGVFFITSGQHRFKAAKQAGVEFAYTVVDSSEKESSVLLEHLGGQKDWNLDAILNFYVHNNIKSYKSFDNFVKGFDFPTSIALKIITGMDIETGKPLEQNYMSLFKAGNFNVARPRLKEAEAIADRISDLINSHDGHLKFGKNVAFIRALYLLINHENFSPKRLQQSLRSSPKGFVVQGKWAETLQAMVDIYNGSLKTNTKRIDFPKIFEPLEKTRRRNRYAN
jgi:hypothetical protein